MMGSSIMLNLVLDFIVKHKVGDVGGKGAVWLNLGVRFYSGGMVHIW